MLYKVTHLTQACPTVPCIPHISMWCTLSFSDTASSQFVKLLAATPSQVLEGITGPEGRELTAQLNGLGEDEVSEGGWEGGWEG